MEYLGFFASIIIGISLGLIGGGGSILTIPILVYLFKVNPDQATSYSLFIVGLTAMFGSYSHYRMGNLKLKSALYFAIPSVISILIIREVIFPCQAPNGIGLSPDGQTLYWAETFNGRVFKAKITGEGEVEKFSSRDPRNCLAGLPGLQYLDSLAVDSDGNVCVATLMNGGITVISPNGEILEHVATGDPITTNICFGGPELRTAYITLSGLGKLVSMTWPRPGLKLNF